MISLIKGYYKDPANGQVTEYQGYAIDVHDAVRRFPDQFSLKPWDDAKATIHRTSIRKAGNFPALLSPSLVRLLDRLAD